MRGARTVTKKKKARSATRRRRKAESTVEDVTVDDAGQPTTVEEVEDDGKEGKEAKDTKTKKCRGAQPDEETKAVMNAFVERLGQVGLPGLQKEYAELKATRIGPPAGAAVAFEANKAKNRYQDVPCFDKTRVALRYNVPPDTDYIHANWVQDMGSPMKMIATQGPVNDTVNDFYRMVWQEKVTSIVMLCRVEENGKIKCAQYWPSGEGEQRTFGTLTVKNIKNDPKMDRTFDYTQLEVSDGKEASIVVNMYLWRDWPDKHVPSGGLGILRMLRYARHKKDSLCVVHCSAGIGRTGTVVALEIAMSRLEAKQPVNIYDIVKEIRTRRALAVQTETQYVFLHRVICEYLQAKGMSRTAMSKFFIDYNAYLKAIVVPQ
uniref:Protein-tyrosine phosphatase n=1 Tax=Steinernema glaseri TaxID=37863 RepID=A0A1I7XXJ4_9BILA